MVSSTAALAALLAGNRKLGETLIALKDEPDINEAAALDLSETVSAHLDQLGMQGPRAGAAQEGAVSLHIAAQAGHPDIAELLVARGFSPFATNHPDVAGDYIGPPALRDTTPTHIAASARHGELATRFLSDWHQHWTLSMP